MYARIREEGLHFPLFSTIVYLPYDVEPLRFWTLPRKQRADCSGQHHEDGCSRRRKNLGEPNIRSVCENESRVADG